MALCKMKPQVSDGAYKWEVFAGISLKGIKPRVWDKLSCWSTAVMVSYAELRGPTLPTSGNAAEVFRNILAFPKVQSLPWRGYIEILLPEPWWNINSRIWKEFVEQLNQTGVQLSSLSPPQKCTFDRNNVSLRLMDKYLNIKTINIFLL